MTEQSPNTQFHAQAFMDGANAIRVNRRVVMKRAGIVVADSPAGLGEAVMKAIKA